ncbi:hypothetical protein [Mycoplasma leonicaptivi]|uniref:hypothetical protein n=1 Tax=Mycoplasma leonicaptivi TaxID=36742 RepID=UPI00048A1170|nr:hypothetical protein [Mycoplasma leonicaptivi]
MKKFSSLFSRLNPYQYIYIALWSLFSLMLISLVGLLGGLKVGPHLSAQAHSNIISVFAFFFLLVFFGAIISTVIVHGFILKKVKKPSDKGGM